MGEDRRSCDNYSPIDGLDDEEIYMMVERGRDEYRAAWTEYIREYND